MTKLGYLLGVTRPARTSRAGIDELATVTRKSQSSDPDNWQTGSGLGSRIVGLLLGLQS